MSNLVPLHVLKQPCSNGPSPASKAKGSSCFLLKSLGCRGSPLFIEILCAVPRCSKVQLIRLWKRVKEISAVQRPFMLLVMSIAHNAARAFVNDIIIQSVNKSVPAISLNSFSPHFVVSN